MTQQAKNCLELYRGGSPATIKKTPSGAKNICSEGASKPFWDIRP